MWRCIPPESGNTVDVMVGQARQAAEAGLRTAWFGQRFDHDAIAPAGIVGR
ncbi:hypothetical protein Airi02_034600 [Actinoallomurus iriomotensis]|uniref:Uncharacterized protein n=1 Tax=Actinoallomurus iriomotensis TaxID=478107 RepID=A0A9W6S1F7_9ACTN|nr:hypothetical protein Airi02_034600 [Actinoallomurus iriomotensis]